MIVLSGFVLAATFFLPAIRACNHPFVPAEEAYDLINDGWSHYANPWPDYVRDLLCGFGMYIAAYLFGALMAIIAIAKLLQSKRAVKLFSVANIALIIIDCLLLISSMVIEIMTSLPASSPSRGIHTVLPSAILLFAFFLAPLLVLIYMLFSIRLCHNAFISNMFAGCLMAFLWFGYWFIAAFIDGVALIGVYLSFAASIVLLISVVVEAKSISLKGWRSTFWQLLTCRLHEGVWKGHCPNCDYNLFGLTEMRCPECGRAFTFEELGVTAEELGHQSIEKQPEASTKA